MKKTVVIMIWLILGYSTIVNAIPIEATLTADNYYALFHGTGDGSLVNFVGRNELFPGGSPGTYNWSEAESFSFDIRNEDGTIASAEDPFVWYNRKHKEFYAIIKDFSGKITGSEPGLAILSSQDGLEWRIPENGTVCIRKEITFTNGDTIQVKNLERPQLLLDHYDNPLVLYAACSVEPVGSKRDGTTFNVHIPLK